MAVSCCYHEYGARADNDVLLLEVATGRAEVVFAPTDAASYSEFNFAPDGRALYLVTNQDRDLNGLARYDLASRKLEWLETPPYEVEEAALSADGRWLAWTVNENGFSRLHLRDLVRRRDIALQPRLPAGVYLLRGRPGRRAFPSTLRARRSRATPGDWTRRRAWWSA